MGLFRCSGSTPLIFPKGLSKISSVTSSISVSSGGVDIYYYGVQSLTLQVPSGYGATLYVYDNLNNLVHTENMNDYNVHTFSLSSLSGKITIVTVGATTININSIVYS